jgi:hypothetical protein
MNLVVELLWIQLHSDELIDPANKGECLKFRKIQIGIEVNGDFRFGGWRGHNRSER